MSKRISVTNQNDYLTKIAKNKSILKEYTNNNERIVYLNDKDEFQLQIFNPYQEKICVEIKVNGIKMKNDVVVNPGQRIWLERYIDDSEPRKLMFSTYEIDDSIESKNATRNNGIIETIFHKEKKYNNYYDYWHSNQNCTYANFFTNKLYDYEVTCNNSVLSSNYDPQTTTLCAASVEPTSTLSCSYSACTTSLHNDDWISSAADTIERGTIETGRIEKGSHSNQKFANDYSDFDSWSFKKETIRILPMSQKIYNENDLRKIYCTNCGKKLNKSFKYCPCCGKKVE